MINIFHRFFNPHCEHCREERQEDSICQTCEVLTVQLARSNVEKDNLLSQIERMANPPVLEETTNEVPEPLKPRVVPWAVRKSILEAEDRAAAQSLRNSGENKDAKQSIKDLEKEVGIPDGQRSETV